ncbi:hypothetical protein ACE3LK_23015 [Enterobacter hormaechei subsp. xiangfangensis]|uniref:hypothetical protein n=1 Tax=Enterobacter hormaechei TaxID=158836 RepID=UPI0033152D49
MIESNLVIPSRVITSHDAARKHRAHVGIRAAARARYRRMMSGPDWRWTYPTPPRKKAH